MLDTSVRRLAKRCAGGAQSELQTEWAQNSDTEHPSFRPTTVNDAYMIIINGSIVIHHHIHSVLLKDLLVQGMTPLLIVHVSPFIYSCITLSFEVQIQSRWFHSDLKAQCYHLKVFQDTSRVPRPSRTLKNRD